MKNTFCLQQLSQTGNLDNKLKSRQCELDLIVRFMEIKAMNPRLTQKEKAKELGYSTSSLKQYIHDMNMLSAYKIQPNSNRRRQKVSNCDHGLVTSNELRIPQLNSKEPSPTTEMIKPKKSKLKGGGNIEINDEYLDEMLHNNNF